MMPTFEQLEYGFRLLAVNEGYLLDAHTSTPDGYWDSTGDGILKILVNCNDYFYPAADCEDIPWEEVKELFEKTRNLDFKQRHDFWMQWIADKRGIPNKHFKDKK